MGLLCSSWEKQQTLISHIIKVETLTRIIASLENLVWQDCREDGRQWVEKTLTTSVRYVDHQSSAAYTTISRWKMESKMRKGREKNIKQNYEAKMLDFSGHPVVKTLCFHCRGLGLIPGQGTKIPHATWHNPKEEKKKKTKTTVEAVIPNFLGTLNEMYNYEKALFNNVRSCSFYWIH